MLLQIVLITTQTVLDRCDLFMKAFDHISQRIDAVYKELTKGKASPMGGVAYLSLEESEVSVFMISLRIWLRVYTGTLSGRY